MTVRTGLCTNYGNCQTADRHERLQVPAGALFVCPECKKELKEIPPASSDAKRLVMGLLTLLVLGAAIFGLFFLIRRPPIPPVTGDVILRLHGSNTIGERLGPALAEKFLLAERATDVRIVPGAKPEEQTVEGILPGEKGRKVIEIQAFGSKTAFEDLGAGKCDIRMASRPIKPEEKEKLKLLGDLTARASEHVLGLDGLAVVVNSANPVDALTIEQIGRIFSGEITSWSEVGGTAGPIQVYARDDKSGTYDTFKSLVLKDQSLVGSARRYENSEKLSDDVAADASGVGFIGMPFIRSAKALKVSAKGALPIRPNPLSVKTEDYPLSRRLFLYKPAASENAWASKFVTFALSDKGQEIVSSIGFMDQKLHPEPDDHGLTPLPGNLPPEYARLIQGTERIPFDFRFKTGSSELDNKAFRDLGRLAQLMSTADYQNRQILLLGFADSKGKPDANLRLSRERAESVERELKGESVRAAVVKGFGQELPVGDNDTEEGRQKNRRVEVWLRK